MSSDVNTKPLNMAERQTTIEEFNRYCLKERESRMNSGENFDAQAFDAAQELTLRKLKVLEDEGWV